jgi:hypothetical protein
LDKADSLGSIPSAYYSTSDPKSFDEFLSKTDILVASLPSTPQTHYLLKEEHFSKLPHFRVFLWTQAESLQKHWKRMQSSST